MTAGFSDEVTFEQKPEAKEAMHKGNSDYNNKIGVGKAAYLNLLNYLKIYYLIYKDHLPLKTEQQQNREQGCIDTFQ